MPELKGGEQLRAYLRDLAAKVEKSGTLEVGFFEGSTYPDGTSVPLVAITNEFGKPAHNQPPRPFMRNTIAAHQQEWGPGLGAALMENGYDTAPALDLLGSSIADQIRGTILNFTTPPDAPTTIKRKGFDSPLRETMDMTRAVGHRVKED